MEPLGLGVGGQEEKEKEEEDNPHVFLVGATRQRLLSGAEEVGLFKEYSDGSMRGFTCADQHHFSEFRGERRGLFPSFLRAHACRWRFRGLTPRRRSSARLQGTETAS